MAVGEYVTNSVRRPTETAENLREYLAARSIATRTVVAGDTIALDPANVTVTVLNPQADPGEDEDEASVVLRLVYGTQSFLLTADAGIPAEKWIPRVGKACCLDSPQGRAPGERRSDRGRRSSRP